MTKQQQITRADYLRELRKKAGMNQFAAADFIGVSHRTYQSLEAGNVDISDLVINQFEVKLKLIEHDTACPFCGGKFKRMET